MKKLIIAMILMMQAAGMAVLAQGREEFNGPFPSWADVKKRFGAKGNGKSDDTKALQTALDSLTCTPTVFNTGKDAYTVVYLPAGTYCISSTLVLRGKIGVSIIGEDPARTTIKWIGGDRDTLLWTNGSAYFKVSRLTWDAGGRKSMEGIGVHWKDKWSDPVAKSRSFAALNIELSDNIFVGGFDFGISGGTFTQDGTSSNDSELTIRRCVFNNCGQAGIDIHGYNALDYWIWDCKFISCKTGIQCKYGNYHVYRSYFSGSASADLNNNNGYYTSARGCYSENTNVFSYDEGSSSNPFKRIFQDNTVIAPAGPTVMYNHVGKITLMNNLFDKSKDATLSSHVRYGGWAKGNYEVLSVGNRYGYTGPVHFMTAQPNKVFSVGDGQITSHPSAADFLKTMDVTPPKVNRRVLEVPLGSDASGIQSIIDMATRLKGQRPVVHFATGTYFIDKPLVIPAGSDMQLVGDGLLNASVIVLKTTPQSMPGKAMIWVKGPSYITLQDLQLGTDADVNQPPRILFENVDQAGARAFLDQIYSHADTSLAVKGLNYLYVEKDNSFFMDGNYILGGNLVQQGKGTARVCGYGGQFARLTVDGNGKFIAKDCWWEGANIIPLNLEGWGTVCVDGAKIAPSKRDSTPTLRVGKFRGKVTFMNMYVQGGMTAECNNPDLSLLVWNIYFYHKLNILDFLRNDCSYKAAFIGLNGQCFSPGNQVCNTILPIDDQTRNVGDLNAFLDQQTAFNNQSKPIPYTNLGQGVSNVRISRVSLQGFKQNGIVFTAQ